MADSLFEQLEQQSTSGGVAAVLKHLISSLQEDKKHHELFEALKMQVRHRAGRNREEEERFALYASLVMLAILGIGVLGFMLN